MVRICTVQDFWVIIKKYKFCSSNSLSVLLGARVLRFSCLEIPVRMLRRYIVAVSLVFFSLCEFSKNSRVLKQFWPFFRVVMIPICRRSIAISWMTLFSSPSSRLISAFVRIYGQLQKCFSGESIWFLVIGFSVKIIFVKLQCISKMWELILKTAVLAIERPSKFSDCLNTSKSPFPEGESAMTLKDFFFRNEQDLCVFGGEKLSQGDIS